MLLSVFIFAFYTVLFGLLVHIFIARPATIMIQHSSIAFFAKIAAGCLYGYFFLHYYGGDDTWLYHNEGLKEFALLKSDPLKFLTSGIIPEGYNGNQLTTIFDSSHSFVKDLELTLLFKLLAIFDLFSGGRYYVNVIFYNVIVFWGSCLLFKAFNYKFPQKRNLWYWFIFYFPPLLFWTSGIRKDGICFAIICALIYQLFVLFEVNVSKRRIIYAASLFMLLFLIRNYLAVTFLPIIIAYSLCKAYPDSTVLKFIVVLVFCCICFFATSLLPQSFNMPLKMAERQHAFLDLKGNSYLPTDSLHGNAESYITILPQALNHVFIRPYFTEAKGPLYIFSFIDIVFFVLLLIRLIIRPSYQFKKILSEPFILSFIIIALLNYIIIGYTVPFLGAIVRYKASFEILFILVLLSLQKNITLIPKPKTSKVLKIV